MARDPQPSSRSRQRGKPVQVQPKKPWGFIAGASVLGLLLVGVLTYAALNSGDGFRDPGEAADARFDGELVKTEEALLTRNHVTTPVTYSSTPATGGDHFAQWQNCNGDVYADPINNENAVHSLEHGAVWVTYKPGLAADQVQALEEAVQGRSFTLMSPLPEQESDIALTSWGRTITPSSATDGMVEDFIDTYANGPQTPEKGATCGGGVATTRSATAPAAPTAPGPTSAPGATTAPAPAASVPAG